MGGIGGPELFVIFLVVLLVFGPKKIPEVARGLGKGLREIRKLTTEFQREINLSDAEDERRRIGGDPPKAAPGPAGAQERAGAPRAQPDAGKAPEAPAPERKDDGDGAPG